MTLHNSEWSVKLVSTKMQIETANGTMLTPNLLVGAIVIQIIFSCAWKNLNQLLVNLFQHVWRDIFGRFSPVSRDADKPALCRSTGNWGWGTCQTMAHPCPIPWMTFHRLGIWSGQKSFQRTCSLCISQHQHLTAVRWIPQPLKLNTKAIQRRLGCTVADSL